MRRLHLVGLGVVDAWRSPLHTALVVFASLSGVVALAVSNASTGAGERRVATEFDAQGVSMITIAPTQTRAVGGRARTGSLAQTLRLADYRALRAAPLGLAQASALTSATLRLRAGDLTKSVTVVGCEPDFFAIKRWGVRQGALFDDIAARQATPQAVLGAGVARDVFGVDDPTGRRITLDRVPFQVVGVLEERGQRLDVANEDDQVYVPLGAAMRRLMNVDYLSGIVVSASAPETVSPTEAALRQILTVRHRAFTRGRDDVLVSSQKGLRDAEVAAAARVGFFVAWAGASAGAVAALGVLALCWIAINARAHEIGVRRALGARASDVLVQFIAQSAFGAAAGAALGAPLSFPLALLVENRLGQPAFFSWAAAITIATLAALAFVAVIAATSLRVARVLPTEALRSA